MSDTKNKNRIHKDITASNLSLIRYFLQGSMRYYALSMLCACMVSLFDMLSPRIITFTVDSVIGTQAPDLPAPLLAFLDAHGGVQLLREQFGLIACAVVAVSLCAALFRYLFRWLNAYASERFVKRMRDELYAHIQKLPYKWHAENSTGDIIQRCTSDVESIKVFVSEQLTSLVRVIVLIVLAVFFMLRIHPFMTLLSSLFIPVVVGYSLYFHRKIGSAFELADTEEGRLSAIAQENLTGVRVVRAFGRERYERERFHTQNEKYTGYWIHLMKILSLNWVTGDIMTGVQNLLVVILGTWFCVHGEITPGQFIAFVSYNAMLIWPVRSLGRVISELSKAGISLERLRYIMRAQTEQDAPGALTPPMDRDIAFEHVSFSYENDGVRTPVLEDVTFTIPAGTTVGILGATGSGKSTLLYLLERLYALDSPSPEETSGDIDAPDHSDGTRSGGRITIGGVDVRDIRASWLRTNIGMVLQEPFLFSRSLEDNIRIAAEDADENEIRAASRIADLEETIDRFPQGYATFVGERGVTLSGGQKQRTAIAQMLIRRPPVMVFDDSLSAVDAETDARIRAQLRSSTGSSTVILVAHRVTTLMHADNILVLDHGRIAEQGTHEQLLARGGIYRRVHDLQLGAGAEAPSAQEPGTSAQTAEQQKGGPHEA